MKDAQFAVRMASAQRGALEREAARAGQTPSQYIRNVIDAWNRLPKLVRDVIANLSKALDMPASRVIETLVIDYAARTDAQREILGTVRDADIPFFSLADGEPPKPSELYEKLLERYKREIILNERFYAEALADVEKRRKALQPA